MDIWIYKYTLKEINGAAIFQQNDILNICIH